MDQPVDPEVIEKIIDKFSTEVPELFGQDLAFGFICGSVARRSAKFSDDIDTLIVLRSLDVDRVSRFRKWVFNIHEESGMKIDDAFPFELFTLETMEEKFASLSSLRASLHYVSSATYDTMTWAEMISNEAKAGEIGDLHILITQADRCHGHVSRWREEIIRDLKSGGDMAFTAQTYRTELQKELAANSLIGGDRIFFGADRNRDLTTFDWVDNDFFTLARLMRRFLPLPESGPPMPMSEIQEMFVELPVLLAGQYQMRALKPRDVSGLYQMCKNPNVARYTSWDAMTHEEVEDFIVAQIKNAGRGECNPWSICEDDIIIGTCAILDLNEADKRCEIGFALKEERWNEGIMTSVANRLIEFVDHELGMREIVAECEVENQWSIKLLEKLGLTLVETRKGDVFKNGTMRDISVYRLML